MAVLQEDAQQPTNMRTSGCNTMCVVFQWFVWQVQTVCVTTQNKTLNKLLTPILLNLYHGQMNFVGNTARSVQDNGFALKTNKTVCTIHNAFGSRSETPTFALLFWQSGCMCILRCWGEMNNQTIIGQGCFHTVGTTVGARTWMVKKKPVEINSITTICSANVVMWWCLHATVVLLRLRCVYVCECITSVWTGWNFNTGES